MEKEKRLKKIFWFDPYECRGAENFLADMARKGWKLVDVVNSSFYFEPCEPQELRYAVKVFGGASDLDLSPSGQTLSYVEFCEAAGWHFVTSQGKMHFFYTKDTQAREIETDSRMERKAVVKAVWARYWFLWLIYPLLLLENMSILFNMNVTFYVTNYMMLLSGVGMLILLLFSCVKFLNFHIWWIQAIRREKQGLSLVYRGRYAIRIEKGVLFGVLILLALLFLGYGILEKDWLGVALVLIMVLALGTCLGLTRLLRNAKTGRGTNFWLQCLSSVALSVVMLAIVTVWLLGKEFTSGKGTLKAMPDTEGETILYTVYQDTVPITLEDMGVMGEGERSSERDVTGTFLASSYSYADEYITDAGENTGLYYEVFTSNFDWIMKEYEREQKGRRYRECSEEERLCELWDAKRVLERTYEDGEKSYVILFEHAALEWEGTELTNEQVELIRNRLHGEISQIPAAGKRDGKNIVFGS